MGIGPCPGGRRRVRRDGEPPICVELELAGESVYVESPTHHILSSFRKETGCDYCTARSRSQSSHRREYSGGIFVRRP